MAGWKGYGQSPARRQRQYVNSTGNVRWRAAECPPYLSQFTSWDGDEFDADGGRDVQDFAGGGQLAGGGIEVEDDDVAGILVGGEEQFSRGVYADVARDFSLGGEAFKDT